MKRLTAASLRCPKSFAGRRVVFGLMPWATLQRFRQRPACGGPCGRGLPFEVDITGLVAVPSTTNQLAVLVRDDTHFSVVREGRDRRNHKPGYRAEWAQTIARASTRR